MTNVLLVGGALLLIAGLGMLRASVRSRRQGAPWRADALQGGASTAYGGLVLAGMVFNGTTAGAVIVWVVAIAMWTALWLGRRERTRFPV